MLSNLRRAARPLALRRPPMTRAYGGQSAFTSVQVMNRDQVAARLADYHDQLLGCNWGDYLDLVHNEPFWKAELEKLQPQMDAYMNDAELGPKFTRPAVPAE